MGTIFKSLAYFRARVPDTTDISTTRATRVRHERHKCHTNDASATRVKNFHLITTRWKHIFTPYICYIANERLQGEELLLSKTNLLETLRFHAKMRLKSAPKKLNFVLAKVISKSYTHYYSCKCSCTFPHSYA